MTHKENILPKDLVFFLNEFKINIYGKFMKNEKDGSHLTSSESNLQSAENPFLQMTSYTSYRQSFSTRYNIQESIQNKPKANI